MKKAATLVDQRLSISWRQSTQRVRGAAQGAPHGRCYIDLFNRPSATKLWPIHQLGISQICFVETAASWPERSSATELSTTALH